MSSDSEYDDSVQPTGQFNNPTQQFDDYANSMVERGKLEGFNSVFFDDPMDLNQQEQDQMEYEYTEYQNDLRIQDSNERQELTHLMNRLQTLQPYVATLTEDNVGEKIIQISAGPGDPHTFGYFLRVVSVETDKTNPLNTVIKCVYNDNYDEYYESDGFSVSSSSSFVLLHDLPVNQFKEFSTLIR